MSLEVLRENLFRVQSSILENPNSKKLYRVPSPLPPELLPIYKMLKIHRSSKPQAA